MNCFDGFTLECFLAVSETGSFTRAAKKLTRTQSAVSQQIIKLEGLVGEKLFERGRRLSLTSSGEILLEYAKKIIQLHHDAMDRFHQPDLQGEVRFGLPEDFATVFLSDVLQEYSFLHPRIQLNVECDLTLNLMERFKGNEFDLVLVKLSKPEDFPNGIEVWSETLEWVGDAQFFMQKPSEPIPLVLAPQPCVYRERAIRALEGMQRKWRIVFSSPSYAGTLAAVQAGMGVSVLARNMVPSHIEIIRGVSEVPPLENTHVSLLKTRSNSVAMNSFETFVLNKLRPSV